MNGISNSTNYSWLSTSTLSIMRWVLEELYVHSQMTCSMLMQVICMAVDQRGACDKMQRRNTFLWRPPQVSGLPRSSTTSETLHPSIRLRNRNALPVSAKTLLQSASIAFLVNTNWDTRHKKGLPHSKNVSPLSCRPSFFSRRRFVPFRDAFDSICEHLHLRLHAFNSYFISLVLPCPRILQCLNLVPSEVDQILASFRNSFFPWSGALVGLA
jgi:hypothetical protein